ncbi:MAG: AAA family ATPase [Caldilineaceae bacterium]|nr:AAA family ATPase [Caldilineaceae bacterium]
MRKTLTLIAIGGLPGSGKSSVARMVAQELEAVHLNSDRIRRALFATRAYTPEESRAVYQALYQRAADALAAGSDVVLDATFAKAAYRQPIFNLARVTGTQLYFVWITCAPEVTAARLTARVGDVSEADVSVYHQLADQFEPIVGSDILDGSDIQVGSYIQIDNSAGFAELKQQVTDKLLARIH